MKKVTIMMSMLLTIGLYSACSSDDEMMGTDHSSDLEMQDEESNDSTYDVRFFAQNPDLEMKQGYWTQNGFIELIPQSKPPYNLLVRWGDKQGKKVIDQILEDNPNIMTKESYVESENEYRITSNLYFESPCFYVSTYYKSSESPTIDQYNIAVLPQIILTMKEGNNVESIMNDYADVLTVKHAIEDWGIYTFECNLKTSRAVLELIAEIYQRDDVESSDFNTYGEYY